MKRALLFSVVLSIVSIKVLVAQELGMGGRLGINSSTILSKGTDVNFGFSGGKLEFYIYQMNNRVVGIEGGLMITKEGFRNHGLAEITYLAIPLSTRFKFGYFTLNLGLRPSFLMDVNSSGGAWKSDFNDTDFILFISPGIQFPNGVTFSTTVNVGLTDITRSDYIMGKHNNFSVNFSVGYTFYRK